MRILHAPTDVGNQAWGLVRGERALGAKSQALVYVQHNTGFGSDFNLHFERRTKPGRLFAAGTFFAQALARYDLFHFYFATTFFPHHIDLPILRALGKKIVFTFQGCDVRPVEHCPPAVLDPIKHSHEPVEHQQARIKRLVGFAKKTYVLNPDLLEWTPTSSFLPYASVNPRDWVPQYRFPRPDEEVIIFHSPSDRLVKGTDHIEAAVRQLQSRGYKIRLDLAFGVSNTEVRQRCARAHLAVDQLLGGWYGAAAVEMMALGKPTLGFIREDWKERVPLGAQIPIVNVTPETIADELRKLLDQRDAWPALAHRGRQFVEHVHDPLIIAKQTLADYSA